MIDESEIEQLREGLASAREIIESQHQFIQQVTAAPFAIGTVLAVGSRMGTDATALKHRDRIRLNAGPRQGETATVQQASSGIITFTYDSDGVNSRLYVEDPPRTYKILREKKPVYVVVATDKGEIEVTCPDGMALKSGDAVRLQHATFQILERIPYETAGPVGAVRDLAGETFCEVDHGGETRLVRRGSAGAEMKVGDRVVLDPTASVVTRNMGKAETRFRVDSASLIDWEDIGGLVDAKAQMRDAIETPHLQSALWNYYGKRPVRGVLLYGPPGNGKTMLGKAASHAIARIHGSDAATGFLYVKGPEILDRYVGESEAAVRSLFQRARAHHQEHGHPAVIFVEEADAILGRRGTGVSSDMERTIVPMFLAEMDGIEESNAMVILTTNRPGLLDPAIVRDGRIDRKILVPRPDADAARAIFRLHLRGIPVVKGQTENALAEAGAAELFSCDRRLYRIERQGGTSADLTLGHMASGGMVAGVVERATARAIRREAGKTVGAGLTRDDVIAAVDDVYHQCADVDHTDEIEEFAGDWKDQITAVRKMRPGKAVLAR